MTISPTPNSSLSLTIAWSFGPCIWRCAPATVPPASSTFFICSIEHALGFLTDLFESFFVGLVAEARFVRRVGRVRRSRSYSDDVQLGVGAVGYVDGRGER
jgi:hypothetical protein